MGLGKLAKNQFFGDKTIGELEVGALSEISKSSWFIDINSMKKMPMLTSNSLKKILSIDGTKNYPKEYLEALLEAFFLLSRYCYVSNKNEKHRTRGDESKFEFWNTAHDLEAFNKLYEVQEGLKLSKTQKWPDLKIGHDVIDDKDILYFKVRMAPGMESSFFEYEDVVNKALEDNRWLMIGSYSKYYSGQKFVKIFLDEERKLEKIIISSSNPAQFHGTNITRNSVYWDKTFVEITHEHKPTPEEFKKLVI